MTMTPDQLREVKIDRCVNCGYLQAEHSPKDGACPCYDMMESYFHPTYKWKASGKPDSEMDERDNRIAELEAAHAAALEEIERLNAAWKAQHAAWKAQQFHLEAEERESAHWKERAEKADRRAERLKGHAEAMAIAWEKLDFDDGESEDAMEEAVFSYRAEFKEE